VVLISRRCLRYVYFVVQEGISGLKHSRISISDVWCRKGRFTFVSLFCFSYIGEMLNGMVIVVDNDDISGSL